MKPKSLGTFLGGRTRCGLTTSARKQAGLGGLGAVFLLLIGTALVAALVAAAVGYAYDRAAEYRKAAKGSGGGKKALQETKAKYRQEVGEKSAEASARAIHAQESVKAEQKMWQRIEVDGLSHEDAQAEYDEHMANLNDTIAKAMPEMVAGGIAAFDEVMDEAIAEYDEPSSSKWIYLAVGAVLLPAAGLLAWNLAGRTKKAKR